MKLKGNTIEFLSTPSARRATIFIRSGMALLLFLSTPSARRATGASVAFDQYEGISIHALREEGDPFSRRTPGNNTRFLSTPSARRATDEQFVLLLSHGISIHALREEGDPGLVRHHPYDHISIHALREEGDIAIIVEVIFEPDFYPRPPRGGRRRARPTRLEVIYFYPRPPRGGRPGSLCHPLHTKQFLSTPSARRATEQLRMASNQGAISIHALREEGDARTDTRDATTIAFLSTPSARRATTPH